MKNNDINLDLFLLYHIGISDLLLSLKFNPKY